MTLTDGTVLINPRLPRAFDGCDLVVEADGDAALELSFRSPGSSSAARFTVPFADLRSGPYTRALDSQGGHLIVQRAPGADLPVQFERSHLVFEPGERFAFTVSPDIPALQPGQSVRIEAAVAPTGSNKPITTQGFDSEIGEGLRANPIEVEITAPEAEGAYTISVTASRELGFSQKLLPLRRPSLARREIELVVVDPTMRTADLSDQWEEVLEIDPASSHWWSRLPEWTRTHRLPGIRAGTLENVRPVLREHPSGPMVELPPAGRDEPAWRAFYLPVKHPGRPHRLVINTPSDNAQSLAVSIIERDAANRSVRLGRDLLFVQERARETGDQVAEYITFWPRTEAPVVLVANPHPDQPAQFGVIRLEQHPDQSAVPVSGEPTFGGPRLLAYYAANPAVFDSLGGQELVDPVSNLSLDGWGDFLAGASRAAQSLRHSGYNTLIATVAADGGSLYPSDLIGPSPIYDSGLLASTGRDPVQKDVLELLFRVCDREGIRLVPLIDLSSQWAEMQRRHSADGTLPSEEGNSRTSVGQSRKAAQALVLELAQRYSDHRSLGGVGIKLFRPTESAEKTTLGDRTAAGRQASDELPDAYPLTLQLLEQLAADLSKERTDLNLVVDPSSFFDLPQDSPIVRQAVSGRISFTTSLSERGVLPEQWSRIPNCIVLKPQFVAPPDLSGFSAVRNRWAKLASAPWSPSSQPGHWTLFGSTPLSLPSFSNDGPFRGLSSTYRAQLQTRPVGAAGRKHIARALASGEIDALVEGGTTGLLASGNPEQGGYHLLSQLPSSEAEVRVENAQPLTVRIYRENNATTACVTNDSPWPCNATLPLEAPEPIDWLTLGQLEHTGGDTGRAPRGASSLSLAMPAYGVQAWKFSSPRVRIGVPQVDPSEAELDELKEQIAQLEARTRNLDYRPKAEGLSNSGFEQSDPDGVPTGWRPSVGVRGRASVDRSRQHLGNASLYLQSYNELGVAVVSSETPAPPTGHLVISAYVQSRNTGVEGTQLLVSAASDTNGQDFFAEKTIATFKQASSEWQRVEIELDSVPLPRDATLRLQFHLKGRGEVWLDDIELSTLSISNARRIEFVKRLYAAKEALAEGNVTDCRRLLDDSWSRRVARHIPPWTGDQPRVAARETKSEQPSDDGEKPLSDRLRGFVPRILR